VGAAALPAGAGQVRADRVDESGVRVGGDQRDSGQAAGDEVFEEGVPPGAGLGGGGGHAEDLAVSVGVDAGGHHHRDLDHPAALADLHRQRVSGQERVRAGVEGSFAEVADQGVEVAGHHRALRLR